MISSFRLLLVALVVLLGLPAGAQAQRDDARDRLEEGSALYRKGDYPGALRKFEEARALFPSPKIYFNIGQALNRLGRPAAAVDALQRFLDEAADADPARRADAAKFLTELEPRIGRVKVTAAAGTEIAVDGRAAGVAPLRRTIPVEPGSHQLTARAPGAAMAAVHQVKVETGEVVEWQVSAGSEATAMVPTTPSGPLPSLGNPGPAATVAPGVPSVNGGAPSAAIESGPQPTYTSRLRRHWPWIAGGAAVLAAGVVTTVLLTRGGDDLPGGAVDWRTRQF
jgi:hypothetical protein